MNERDRGRRSFISRLSFWLVVLLAGLVFSGQAAAFTLHVIDGETNQPMTDTAFRWMVEVDNTFPTEPGAAVTDQLSFAIHNSYAPLAMLVNGAPAKGDGAAGTATVNVDTSTERHYISVLPNSGYAMGGTQIPADGTLTDVYVYVEPYPLPTAQISVFVFKDHWPINNAPDNLEQEPGLGGATLVISDAGGPLWQDAFGNPIGTQYDEVCLGAEDFDPDACKTVTGDGVITTLTEEEYCTAQGFDVDSQPEEGPICDTTTPVPADPSLNPYDLMPGEALIKYIPPGKYGIVVDPPADGREFILTSTIEGTPTVDAWVMSDEAPFFIEQFGAASPWHAFYGFVVPEELPWNVENPGGPGSLAGQNRFNHFSRPPNNQSLDVGPPVADCWYGVNDPVTGEGLYAAACGPDSTVDIAGIPEGDWELVTWDVPLDALFSFHPFTIPETIDAAGNPVNPPEYDLAERTFLSSRWFGTLKGKVFIDADEDGFPDPGEGGLGDQAVNLRFRDGTIYQATVSSAASGNFGEYELTEVFPFFKWLVTEVDFARYKATGMTAAADMGGTIPEPNGWITPSFGALNPQPQTVEGTYDGTPIINDNTGNEFSRTETGEVLTQAMQVYLTQTNVIDWGKNFYGAGENGGISGMIYYAVTRAEDDPKWAAAEPWEPGIPNVQLALYHDDVAPFGKIDCLDDTTGMPLATMAEQQACTPQLADVDNFPFQWSPLFSGETGYTGVKGPEDIDHNGNAAYDFGDAVQVTYTDSWDLNKPTGCIQDLPLIHGAYPSRCGDSYGTWNQVRDGVFDGGYAFTDHYESGLKVGFDSEAPIPLQNGTYIVEAGTPHGYLQIREQDKNVDFGDEFTPSTQKLPPVCVGEPHTVPDYMSLWTDDAGNILPDVAFTPEDLAAPYAGETRPYCDRKQVTLTNSLNAAAEFFFFTKVPKAARGVGFINNDLAPEFNMASPAFGEKMAPSWLPVSLRDWNGREVARTYSDEFGSYEFLVPGSYTVNQASPTGVTLAMYNIILNDPLMPADPANPTGERIPDPWHDSDYTVPPWVFQFETGRSSYIDSPIVPTAAFVGYPSGQLDVNSADGVPVVSSVSPQAVCSQPTDIVITSPGTVSVSNPDYDPAVEGSTPQVARDYGFGNNQGSGTVVLDGVELAVVSWSNTSITATVAGVTDGTGNVFVTRDNGASSELAVAVQVGGSCANDLFVDAATGVDDPANGSAGSPYATIQYAVDQAAAGARIFVGPGTYNEQVILYKELGLYGSGPGTIINSRPAVQSIVQEWRNKYSGLGGTPTQTTEVPGILVSDPQDTFAGGAPDVSISGFKITGGTQAGGIYVLDHGYNAEIYNNLITGNQGMNGGGITVGEPEAANAGNTNIHIHDNQVNKNAGVNGGGGIALYAGADGYIVENNEIIGNFSRGNGAGISHVGTSDGGVIQANVISLNEAFYFAPGGGAGGGIYIGGDAGSDGAGSVVIDANLIKSNMAGSATGGGIRINGLNTATATGYTAEIYNNMIVNNVAAYGGGGISMQDAANVAIINNTVANNDSTSTSLLAFPNTNLNPSQPRPAGIQANVHSAALAAEVGGNVPNPTMVNNIVYQNRSYYHEGLNVGGDALTFSSYWDLGITGQAVPGSSALNPTYSLLTSLSGVNGEDYSGSNNLVGNPAFVMGYFNTLQSAATFDEGGNNISVRFAELDPMMGDYHIFIFSSALDAGNDLATVRLGLDYDGDARPLAEAFDIGADELDVDNLVFQVLTPNGGEIMTSDDVYTINWNPLDGAVSYRLHYSIDNGSTWLAFADTDGATISYDWTVPLVLADEPDALVRVSAFSTATPGPGAVLARDVSDAPFTILAGVPPFMVVDPNGGETMNSGDVFTINWNAQDGAGSYRLHYSVDNGASWQYLADTDGATISYDWTVPLVLADEPDALVRVSAFSTATPGPGAVLARDVSDAPFTILAGVPPFMVVDPNGGETMNSGDVFTINWNAQDGAGSYRLHYSVDNGASWQYLADTDGATISYDWTVPLVLADEPDALVRVSAFSTATPGPGAVLARDVSDAPFTIQQPAP